MKTTLTKIREHQPCGEGWTKLLKHLGKTQADDEPLDFLTILESNGLDDALWCVRSAPEYNRDWRLFAVWCARQVQHLMTDEHSIHALDVAERHANGQASEGELATARDAAWAATARATARATVRAAVRDTVAAAWATARDTAAAASDTAAWAATARAAARDTQKEMFIKMCHGNAPWQVEEMK